MIDIPTVTGIVTTVSIIVGIIFTVFEIRHLTKIRRTDIVMKIYERFGTKEMIEAINRVGSANFENFKDYREKYGFTDITQVAVLFDGVGALLEQDLIDIKMADHLFGPTLKILWLRMKPVIYAMRNGLKEPSFFGHFEYLVNRLDSFREQT